MKKAMMKQYWRIQQSQTIISMGFWVTTLTLLIWPYISHRFTSSSSILGIHPTYFGLFGIASIVALSVLSIGWAYDVFLGLWREHLTVVTERNPFSTYMIAPPMGLILAQTNAILRKIEPEDEDIQRHCNFVDRWLEWNSENEIWARAANSFDKIIHDDDPFLFHLSEEGRDNLEKASKEIQDI
jgi:hypothetical protein